MSAKLDLPPYKIVLFHIGGCDGCGPIGAVLRKFPRQCVVFIFEARDSVDGVKMQEYYSSGGVQTIAVDACVSGSLCKRTFYVNKHVEGSSLLPPSSKALGEHIIPYTVPGAVGITTWEDATELDYTIDVQTIRLKEFIEENCVIPDVLSIDAQGVELDIMMGAENVIDYINVVVAETEFFEIYAGQALFHEQFTFLTKHGFRLTDLLGTQKWHPGPAYGMGFLTVAEALWFKQIDAFFSYNKDRDLFVQGIKSAAVAFSFDRFSYAYMLLKRLVVMDKSRVYILCGKYGFGELLQLFDMMERSLGNYKQDNYFFLRKYEQESGNKIL
jgi:FkbM family methyltransferase